MMVLLYTLKENLTCNQAFLYFFVCRQTSDSGYFWQSWSEWMLIADEHFASHRYQPAFIVANGRNRLSYQQEK